MTIVQWKQSSGNAVLPDELNQIFNDTNEHLQTINEYATLAKSYLEAGKYFLAEEADPIKIALLFAIDELIEMVRKVRKTSLYMSYILPPTHAQTTDPQGDFISFQEFGILANNATLRGYEIDLFEIEREIRTEQEKIKTIESKLISTLAKKDKVGYDAYVKEYNDIRNKANTTIRGLSSERRRIKKDITNIKEKFRNVGMWTIKNSSMRNILTNSLENVSFFNKTDVVGCVFYVGVVGGKDIIKIIESSIKIATILNRYFSLGPAFDLIFYLEDKYQEIQNILKEGDEAFAKDKYGRAKRYKFEMFNTGIGVKDQSSLHPNSYQKALEEVIPPLGEGLRYLENKMIGFRDSIMAGLEAIEEIIDFLEQKIEELEALISAIEAIIIALDILQQTGEDKPKQGAIYSLIVPPSVNGISRIIEAINNDSDINNPLRSSVDYIFTFFAGGLGGGTGLGLLAHLYDPDSISFNEAIGLREDQWNEKFDSVRELKEEIDEQN